MNDNLNFLVSRGRRLVLFLCMALLFYIISSALISVIISKAGVSPAALRICAVLQDLLVFIVPALLTAVLITRLSARFLCVEYRPKWNIALVACLVLLVSMPAIDVIVDWNESIRFPDSMRDIERVMRWDEISARHQIQMLIGDGSTGSMIVAILIVGLMAAFSEELFFRGTFQRLLSTGGMKAGLAVFVAAFIFSAIHFQFYGFFGRLILAMYFGYLLVWTGNLWIPVIVHAFNNIIFIISNRGVDTTVIGQEASMGFFGEAKVIVVTVSVILTVGGLILLRRMTKKNNEAKPQIPDIKTDQAD